MSDGRNGQSSDADAGGEGDPFDSLDEAETDIDEAATDVDEPATDIDDPFAELGAGVAGDDPDEGATVDSGDDHVDPDPVDPDPVDPGFDSSPPGDASGARRDDPFAELGPVDSGVDPDDAFERMDVAGPAEEDVWESLDADAEWADALGEAASVSGGGDTEHVVSKRTYCQQCPHFTPPPEVACAHEGTSILEAVGFDEFRVRNCPMVSEEDPTFDSGE